ncbi:hypothetical protein CISIN_1g044231mg [Citrus sinensis]|uniref:Uncharacterized protein n=1 Tax=Citrus sinensis TaxID=2711 RepID=A0A067D7T4_CITSI|nr:hypothetical protein CISIN_1g044231mg [Citrus sinensis]
MSILEDFTPIIIARKDLEGIDMPHIDLLVVTLEITNITVKRIFIDGGSRNKTEPKKINLFIKVGDKIASVDFLVVNAPSTYNAILGRHWLHYMEVVPSTLHQVVRCVSLTRSGTFDIKGD